MENWAIKHISKVKLKKHFKNPTLDKLLSTFFWWWGYWKMFALTPVKIVLWEKMGKKEGAGQISFLDLSHIFLCRHFQRWYLHFIFCTSIIEFFNILKFNFHKPYMWTQKRQLFLETTFDRLIQKLFSKDDFLSHLAINCNISKYLPGIFKKQQIKNK